MTEDRSVHRKSVRIDEGLRNCLKRVAVLELQLECLNFVFQSYDQRYAWRSNDKKADEEFSTLKMNLINNLNGAQRDLLLMSGLTSDSKLCKVGLDTAQEFFLNSGKSFTQFMSGWGVTASTVGRPNEREELHEEIAEAREWAQGQGPLMRKLRAMARAEKRGSHGESH